MELRRRFPASSLLALRSVAAALAVIYIVWNVGWLSLGKVPPALFLALTGLPAPTTGGLHSIRALISGDWRLSLAWNPLAVPWPPCSF